MSLQQYCNKRMVSLSATASVYDGLRAMESNHIGAVIVHEAGQIVGIVTDRDIAYRVVGRELNARKTPLRDVMSPKPVTASIDDLEEQAVAAMRTWHIRRLPLLDGDRLVGMVTLDDLILSGTIGASHLADIVRGQLMEPATNKPAGTTHPGSRDVWGETPSAKGAWRGLAHEEQTLGSFVKRLQEQLEMDNPDRALAAFQLFASNLARRMTPQEAHDFASQLPRSLGDRLMALPAGPDLERAQ